MIRSVYEVVYGTVNILVDTLFPFCFVWSCSTVVPFPNVARVVRVENNSGQFGLVQLGTTLREPIL